MLWEIMDGSDHCCFFGCIQATANVLTASNTEAGLVVTHDYKVVASTRLKRIKKLDRDYSHWQMLSLACSLKYHVTLLLSHQSQSACKDGGYRE